ncbi:bifunctional acetate--CoA ligase family protein/GNAT family N-acetyltransferase [Nitratireductor mangrovi]|uniref:Bifunctional acetate--CoA ligase family protein/GNAT family N-acetyltransferase n=1 Tax=Nitratireductor mangrovi TaxID=2599600 RepID=A0A5B8KZY9_9HYPH|nr:bifunctional acetate--CoA ligase family protein/GNAT family N-acetyltransferase [Nitratireductor mangrovi]QDZ01171.1 bifunctional acetate--CoA ligase family protein/GNAT family N-acetyltransferase [Nitratireductor mangrovi]
MTIRNLEYAVDPKSVAVIGASIRDGAVGKVVMDNILGGGFSGKVFPVNPKYDEVAGLRCYPDASSLPQAPDLGVIVTPPQTVPGIISQLGEKGTRAAVVITAGLTRENGLRQAMLDAARPHLFRIIGPNTLGLMLPPAKLNAGFSHMAPSEGNIALLSQSGAIATSLIDWAAENNLGFSHVVSLGDMADVDVGDWLDMLAGDPRTGTIIMYLETIPEPRKFMSAARAAARIKPVIAIKSGRHEAAAKAAATHTGALSGADRVVEAALRRAGILRVKGLAELFDAAEITARFAPLGRSRVGVVTNGGGAGVLSVDQLADCGSELAGLSTQTIERLNGVLPPTWSHANPVDIIGDASPERYRDAVAAVAADDGVDAVLVLTCPTGLASPTDAARAVADLTTNGRIQGKPILTCWLGEHTARKARAILQDAGVASFATPADASSAVSYLSDWSRAQRALTRVPAARQQHENGARETVVEIFSDVARERRRMLTEPEAKAVIAAYGIPVPTTIVASTPDEVEAAAAKIINEGSKVVVKLLSKAISHKSDVGGVVLNLETPSGARDAAAGIEQRVRDKEPDADIHGYAVQPMIVRKGAQELILGVSGDPIFGPVLLFGSGGVSVEVVDDTAIALPPIDDVLAGDLIDSTRIGRLLAGYRDRKPADRARIIDALVGLSRMIVDFPCLVAADINPLLADADGVVALDARIEIDPDKVEIEGPNPAIAIRPYPAGWSSEIATAGRGFEIRPIEPADIRFYPDFLARISADDIRLRFLAPRRHFSDEMLKRLTQLDYDRDIAFVALDEESEELAGVGRLSFEPDKARAEFGLLVRTDLQGHGLGWALLERLISFARSEGTRVVEGAILDENEKMLAMSREAGFSIERHPSEKGVSLARLVLD